MPNMLEVEKVDQHFRCGFLMRRTQVLHAVELRVPAKSIFGFLGPNGAGKTTLITLIAGLRKPSSGVIKVGGHDATGTAARMKTGYLPERPYFHDHLTGEGLLKYVGTLSGMSRPKILARIPKVLSLVGLTEARRVELRKYSKGMLQRIGIAQAILHDPEFLVLDEPMSGLDPLGRKEMRELIVGLAAGGRTIFFSSHIITDVEAICDNVAVINKGRMIGCGPIGEFLSKGPVKTEIAFAGVDAAAARGIDGLEQVREMPDGIRALVPGQEAVGRALTQLLDLKARILWVNPVRPSLEEIFEQPAGGRRAP
ncbi:MAG: hypothetical protein A2583_09635 [Bdellovibrionales bacterium RIFOXYD1_FULL_53_11]|nr:MAG: hypothetical protein A2583_09635 [Bdellovibrionales bacterium RIFOXYD1_FULL_53_11]